MKRILTSLLLVSVLICGSASIADASDKPVETNGTIISDQNSFTVTAWYRSGYETYKAKLKLKLVRSMYGINEYSAQSYAVNQFNGQWQWCNCNASCHYDQVKRQYSVFIGGTTFYFDDPLE